MVQVLVKPRRKKFVDDVPRALCGECGYEFPIRKKDRELRGPRRCPRCRVRLVQPGLGFLHGRDHRQPKGGA